jgi:hypothetical protein
VARGLVVRLQKGFVVLNSKELGARCMQYRCEEGKIAVELCSLLSPNVATGSCHNLKTGSVPHERRWSNPPESMKSGGCKYFQVFAINILPPPSGQVCSHVCLPRCLSARMQGCCCRGAISIGALALLYEFIFLGLGARGGGRGLPHARAEEMDHHKRHSSYDAPRNAQEACLGTIRARGARTRTSERSRDRAE